MVTHAFRILPPAIALVVGSVLLAAGQPPDPRPARYLGGPLPPLPALVAGGGEVLLELEVTLEGQAGAATVLRATPPFTDMLLTAVRQWQFDPATTLEPPAKPGGAPVVAPAPSAVLVAGVFRPPTIVAPTIGELPRDVNLPSRDIPFPLVLKQPPWPPLAVAGGVVLVEARVDGRGSVAEARLVDGSPGFEAAALDTVRGWSFRPVRTAEAPEESYVYAVLGFPVPVTPTKKK